ncbi:MULTISPECIES: hypothetical protein [unclassified Microcoleus]|uniref:hypothetical protein n=1 Tax=unclassified Microcoleus TaxID=2642155 RepID=UPI002FD3B11C
MQKLGGVPFTASTIATKAESNTPAIEQTAFVTLQPPRKLLAVPAFASANAQTQVRARTPGFTTSNQKLQLCLVADSTNSSIFGILETSTQLII